MLLVLRHDSSPSNLRFEPLPEIDEHFRISVERRDGALL
jgi:hypothetical protein